MPALVESMMFFGEKPWHGIGTELEKIPTSKEAIIAAGLDWHVEKRDLFVHGQSNDLIKLNNHFATKRLDKEGEKSVLGIVGKRYRPVQNIEAFDFFDYVVGKGEAIYHTAGSLMDGKIIWILAKLPDEFKVSKNDSVELYTLLMNRHDGTGALIVQSTPIRVVCYNTLSMALSEAKDRLSFKHTKNVTVQMQRAAESIKMAKESFSETLDAYKLLASKEINSAQLNDYYNKLLDNKTTKAAIKSKENFVQLFENEKQINKFDPTLWLAYNTVTGFVDHIRGKNKEKRLNNAWLGSGNSFKNKAFDIALQMAA